MGARPESVASEPEDKRLAQVQRIARSSILQSSEALCSLLRFLAEHSIASPAVPIKEHQIATEVLGRQASFDPRLDSAVRVQMSRLRVKLGEYYNTVGREDPIVVEIPKGGHTVLFTEREVAPPAAASGDHAESRHPPGIPWKWIGAGLVAAVLILVAAKSTFWNKAPERPRTSVEKGGKSSSALDRFWRSFLRSSEEPLVVFSNAEFVGRPETGLRYFDPGHDRAEAVFDHYTGVGEVMAMHALDEVFGGLGRKIRVKRGRLLNWDDAQNRDVVFLGSPSENLSLREMSLGRDFRFQTMAVPPRSGDLGIVNLHPAAGEQPVYFGSRGLPITEDYALVETSAPSGAAQSVLMLAGTTTFGTQAAAAYLCDEEHVSQLLPRVQGESGRLAPFTALLRVRVQRGFPVETTLVTLRKSAQ